GKMFDKKPGLIIDENGITDNTNGTSIGLIEWNDIAEIERLEIAFSKMLLIKTNKPEKYIQRAPNGIARQAMKANYKSYGTPLSIIANSLKINFNELEKLIEEEWKKRQIV
ncbi:MAG: STM3941 family protein, partial [Bacteroidota bacterium]